MARHLRALCDEAPIGMLVVAVSPTTQDCTLEYANTDGKELFAAPWLQTKCLQSVASQTSHRKVTEFHEVQFVPLNAQQVLVYTVNPHKMVHDYVAQVEDANNAKTRFMSEMSHELRTPANGIMGSLELCLQQDQLSTELRELLSVAFRCCKSFVTLLDDLVDTTTIEQKVIQLKAEDFNVIQLVQDIVNTEEKACSKNLSFHVQVDPTCSSHMHSDAKRLRQILTNLVSNAVKYTSQGSVTVRLKLQSGHVVFEVQDTGDGIELTQPGVKDLLFQRFGRLKKHRRSGTQGHGLGLWICYRLAKLMRGHLDVQSELNQGSTFILTIPYTPIETQNYMSPGVRVRRLSQPINARVLVVEDIHDNQVILTKMLQRMGAVSDVAENGQVGVDMWWQAVEKKYPYDMILMDSFMPVMTGRQATERIREMEQKHHFDRIAIIGCSANVREGRNECLQAGMDDYIVKPITLKVIRKLLTQVRTHKKSFPMYSYNRLLATGILEHICDDLKGMLPLSNSVEVS